MSEGKKLHIASGSIEHDGLLAKLTQYANVADALAHVEKSVEYVVQIPLKHKEAFQAGDLFLNQNSKTGVLWPTLYKALDSGKREFVDNLPIKEEELFRGNPFESVAISYHNLYMQQQINELAEVMNRTYKAVERIEQGQMDDRIGLLIAGRDQIILSMHLPQEERFTAIELGRSKLLTAQKQLLQTLKRRIGNFEAIAPYLDHAVFVHILGRGALLDLSVPFLHVFIKHMKYGEGFFNGRSFARKFVNIKRNFAVASAPFNCSFVLQNVVRIGKVAVFVMNGSELSFRLFAAEKF